MRSVPAEHCRPVAVSDLQQPQQSGATGVPRRFRQLKIQIQFFGFNFSLNVSKQSHFTDSLAGSAGGLRMRRHVEHGSWQRFMQPAEWERSEQRSGAR